MRTVDPFQPIDPARLPKCLAKYASIIQDVSDERDNGDGYWVYFVEGWRDDEGETHCVHENNPRECARRVRHATRCTDPQCCSGANPPPENSPK